jgi:hypothetical protein
MTIDLQGLEALGFTENQAFDSVTNKTDKNGRNPLFLWVDFENRVGFTVAQQTAYASQIYQEILRLGTVENCGGNIGLARQFGVPLSWVEELTPKIFNIVEQIKNGATPTEV